MIIDPLSLLYSIHNYLIRANIDVKWRIQKQRVVLIGLDCILDHDILFICKLYR